MSSLPHAAYVVSRPRRPTDMAENMLPRCDAPRPYWLRDWQDGFGGFTKVCEYGAGEEIKRMYSVAYVIKPRTMSESACLCFSLMSKAPTENFWHDSRCDSHSPHPPAQASCWCAPSHLPCAHHPSHPPPPVHVKDVVGFPCIFFWLPLPRRKPFSLRSWNLLRLRCLFFEPLSQGNP